MSFFARPDNPAGTAFFVGMKGSEGEITLGASAPFVSVGFFSKIGLVPKERSKQLMRQIAGLFRACRLQGSGGIGNITRSE
jgi:hypothetical protein